MDDIEKNEFLREQLDLLKRKRTDENLEWQDVADFRSEFNGDLEHRDTVRKGSKLLYEYIDAGWVNEPVEKENNSDNSELIKMRKEKIKLSDARVEYNRLIRQEARKESYVDMVKRIICENVEPMNIPVHYTLFNSSTDLLCHLTDVHCGIEIHNWKNDFNEDILKKRIEKFTSDILDIRGMHESENCYLVIGEILSGIIHNNLRLQNNMDLMEQFKYVSELISAMLSRMANHFNHIYVYTTPGNHSRISPKKEEALDGENMDVLLPFYLKARVQNVENITICDNTVEPEIAMFNIRGNNVFAAHGHKDSPSNVVQNFTMMFNIKPDIVLLGHRHTNAMETVYDTKVIQSGCVSGSDAYAMSIRKTNKPEQTVSVIGENGLICLYDIQLN
uniref:DNA polymerase II small subunit n=1 Tax=Siphoviridae sp. ct4Ap70 TaxID=2825328 RepID=A0A8S5NWE5_9CAUD|nr:MAG TPA: DNA polymerase II small subunit [Siphoviridae sp. ct4Ap70]